MKRLRVNKVKVNVAIACVLTVCQGAMGSSFAALSEATESEDQLEKCQAVFILLSGPTSASYGDVLRYRIEIRNEGACQISDALVTDYLPRESVFISASPEPNKKPSQVMTGIGAQDEPTVPVQKVVWENVSLGMNDVGDVFEVAISPGRVSGRVITNSACIEHPKIGRRCDTLDTYIR